MSDKSISMRTIAALVIGNAFEWYDFMVYSFMTVFIAVIFFPNVDRTISLLAAYATFGVAFCVRPIGGICFGLLADKRGRKSAVTIGMMLMTIAMLMIATAHTYAQVGIIAPIYILVARLLQGFSAGGEFGPSSALLYEVAPQNKRSFYGSWQMFGQCLAIWLGSVLGYLLTQLFTMQQLIDWGWRIPFIFGLLIAPIGVYIRYHLHEERVIATNTVHPRKSFIQLVANNIRSILLVMGLMVGGTAATYTVISFLPTYVSKYLNLPLNAAFVGMTVASSTLVILIPFFGWLGDKYHPKTIIRTALIGFLLLVYPLYFSLVHEPSIVKLYVTEFSFAICLAAYFGVFVMIAAELFPRPIRATGLAISSNIAVMTFGGFGQLIVTWLIHVTGSAMAPTYYLIPTLSISLLAALLLPSSNRIVTHENIGLALATRSD